jgi:type IV secretory pathway TrbL component
MQQLTTLLTAQVLGMVISGGICLIALCVWEVYQGENAFFAVHLFKDVRGFGMNCICSAVGGISYVALSIIWPTRKYPFLL